MNQNKKIRFNSLKFVLIFVYKRLRRKAVLRVYGGKITKISQKNLRIRENRIIFAAKF